MALAHARGVARAAGAAAEWAERAKRPPAGAGPVRRCTPPRSTRASKEAGCAGHAGLCGPARRDVARRPALRPATPRGRGRGRAQARVRSSSGVTQAPCSLPLPLASVATLPGASVTGLKLVAERTKPREPRQAERPNHPRPPDTGGNRFCRSPFSTPFSRSHSNRHHVPPQAVASS